MARNESPRQTRTLARLHTGARVLVGLLVVVGLLTAQAGSVAAATDASAETAETAGAADPTCGFWSIVLDLLGLADNDCANALENGMVGIGP